MYPLLPLLPLLLLTLTASAQPDIVKSPNDDRQYAYKELSNGLRTLVISDPDTDRAAAALDVNVGFAADPDGREGMAHYLEHLLFLGTEKYPDADDYKAFIAAHGGNNNAYTAQDHTNYFFDIDKDWLEPALDRFAQFFIAPLFTARYVERERQVVHSEYRSKLRSDGWRQRDALRAVQNPAHPAARFSVGSAETLAERDGEPSLREQLIAFYGRHYSAERMTLVVLGKEPVAQLQAWVEEKFAAVPRHHTAAPPAAAPQFAPATLPRRLDVVPVRELRQLSLRFPIPATRPHYRAKPLYYLSNLLGHEGPGSLLSLLKARGWVENLWAGGSDEDRGGAVFSVSMELTPAGVASVDEVVEQVFGFLALVRAGGVERWRFDEQRRLAEIGFRFQERGAALPVARGLAALLHEYPPADVLRAGYIMEDYDPALIRDYLDRLTPDNLLVMVTAPSARNVADAVSPHFATPYRVSAIDAPTLARWRAAEPDRALHLALPNPFIPQNLTLKTPPPDAPAKPGLVDTAPGFEFWHRHDISFKVPKAELYFSLRSPVANGSPRQAVLTQLFVRLSNDALAEFTYPAYLAGLSYRLYSHMRGFSVRISGYDDKQRALLTRILDTVQNPAFSAARFRTLKDDLRRDIANGAENPPYQQAYEEILNLLIEPNWSDAERLAALETVTFEELRAFVPTLFERVSVSALAVGNVDDREAAELAGLLRARLVDGAVAFDVPRGVGLKLGDGDFALRLDSRGGDSALVVYFQGPDKSLASRARYALLSEIVSEPFFNDLRTEQKLGYIVSASAFPIMEVPGLAFVVQSPSADPATLEGHVERFLREFRDRLAALDDATFNKFRYSLLAQLARQDDTLQARASRYWTEIDRLEYDFDSRERFAAAVRELDKQALLAGYERELLGPQRSRLAVRAVGRAHADGYSDAGLAGEPVDPRGFKHGREAFPG